MERSNHDYWISVHHCYYNAFYNTHFLKNTRTHMVRAGELYVNGVQKTDGELDWKVDDFNDDLTNAHFWVETLDGKIIDWMANFYMKSTDKKIWNNTDLEANGIIHRRYKHEEQIIKKARQLYGNAGETERKQGREFKKCWKD